VACGSGQRAGGCTGQRSPDGPPALSPTVSAALRLFRFEVLHFQPIGACRAPRRRACERERAAAAAALADARREAAERAREVEALAALSLRGDATVQECVARLRVRAPP
jgi:hypothetical protein